MVAFFVCQILMSGCQKKEPPFEIRREDRIRHAIYNFLFFEGIVTSCSNRLGLGEALSWRATSFPSFGKMMLSHPGLCEWQDLKSTELDGIGEFFNNPKTGNCEIFVVFGQGTVFDSQNRHLIGERQIPPSTLLIIELIHSISHWMAPEDLDVSVLLEQEKLSNLCVNKQSVWVAFADGLVVEFQGDIPGRELGNLAVLTKTSLESRDELISRFGRKSIVSEQPSPFIKNQSSRDDRKR
jgi:hypothetical protein